MPSEKRATTPLFCDAAGRAFTRDSISKLVKALMVSIGLNPAFFGAHSLRIGGATAALAGGIPPNVIRVTGRWNSEVWLLYARLTKQAALRVSSVIGSTAFDATERGTFVTEDLELLPLRERPPAQPSDNSSIAESSFQKKQQKNTAVCEKKRPLQ